MMMITLCMASFLVFVSHSAWSTPAEAVDNLLNGVMDEFPAARPLSELEGTSLNNNNKKIFCKCNRLYRGIPYSTQNRNVRYLRAESYCGYNYPYFGYFWNTEEATTFCGGEALVITPSPTQSMDDYKTVMCDCSRQMLETGAVSTFCSTKFSGNWNFYDPVRYGFCPDLEYLLSDAAKAQIGNVDGLTIDDLMRSANSNELQTNTVSVSKWMMTLAVLLLASCAVIACTLYCNAKRQINRFQKMNEFEM